MRTTTLLLALLGAVCAAPAGAKTVRIAVFHTNDIHGWMMSRPAQWNKDDPKRPIGGVGALAAAVKKLSAPGEATLLLDAGDWYQGTPEGTMPKGAAMAELFNLLGYDAVVLGNHEYDIGEAALKELVAKVKVPVLGANVLDASTGRRVPYARGHILKKVGGVKVGIFGLITSNMRRLTFEKNIAGLRFEDEVAAARREVAELRAEGAQVIIALTHVGLVREGMASFLDDRVIAAQVPGIDLIVGGHTHMPVEEPLRDAANKTMIVQAGSYLTKLGKAVLEFDAKAGKVVASSGRLHDLWVDEYGEDPKALEVVRRYQQEVGRTLDVVIATATERLHRDRDRESPMGDWMTDCQRKWTKTDLAFQNGGGIRSDINSGPVLLRHIFEVMPFDNTLVTMNLTGRQVREVLEQGVSGRIGMLQMSGPTLRYSPSAPIGARLREVKVGGVPLKDDQTYSATAVDFMVQGGDGYGELGKGADVAFTETLMRDVLAWCARTYSPITAPPAGRIVRD